MVETTVLVVPGKKISVPRFLKRILQIAIGVALTSAVFLVMIVGNGMVVGRNASLQSGMNAWLAFILKLPRFRGHPTFWVEGVHDVEAKSTLPT
jgi:hypothetical protein